MPKKYSFQFVSLIFILLMVVPGFSESGKVLGSACSDDLVEAQFQAKRNLWTEAWPQPPLKCEYVSDDKEWCELSDNQHCCYIIVNIECAEIDPNE